MSLIEHILEVAKQHQIDLPNSRFIIACSGGVDSIVLAYLLKELNVNAMLAHVNYQMRGEESDRGEELVRKTAAFFNWPFEVFKAGKIIENGTEGSIQIMARNIRFEWFEKLKLKHGADYVVLAQHKEDQIETFFIQLLRAGSGESIAGMEIVRDFYFRPLLAISKNELIHFALQNNITWIEDSSNQTDKYLRNKIRHLLLPVLNQIDSNYSDAAFKSLKYLSAERNLLNKFISAFKNQHFIPFETGWKINRLAFISFENKTQLFFELLKSFGFNFEQCASLEQALNRKHGANFLSTNWNLYVDREFLLLRKKGNHENIQLLSIKDSFIIEPINFIPKVFDSTIAIIDADKLSQNLSLRTWKHADFFFPVGMNGRKKISDFYTDLKLSEDEKSMQLLLMSDNEVVWVVNKRIDKRFIANRNSKNIVSIKLKR
jgi:tRNA(Ile)-lysidine synthase